MKKIFFFLLLVLSIGVMCTSCNDDDEEPERVATNRWVFSQMQTYYYWTDNMPINPSLDSETKDFFSSLLYKAEDRFSWIQNAEDLRNSLNGISESPGFEIKLNRESQANNNLIGQIIYVFPNSPAARAGIVRGDLFNRINGQTLTVDNYSNLLFGEASLNMVIDFVKPGNFGFNEVKTTRVISEQVVENPIMLDSIYTINNKKFGYFAYKNFFPDAGDKTLSYDKKIVEIFGRFKNAGISELVLDLRMNTGGAVTSANMLASLIVKGATANDVFGHSRYNTLITNELSREPKDYFTTKFTNEANNVGTTISRLVVLTSNHTASASELIINCLRPYMDVILIGDKTYGKNVGSITITDTTNVITWGLQPIVVKLFNKNNQSDYTNGFTPDILDEDNQLILYPFGDLREPLLRTAFTKIYGISLDIIAPLKSAKATLGAEIANSVAFKRGAYGLWMDR